MGNHETAISPKIRLFKHVDKTPTCWNWMGSTREGRYGSIGIGSRTDKSKKIVRVHRLSWEIFKGEIPKGMCVCHKCDNSKCIRPSHLFLGTHADNMRDMALKKRVISFKGQKNGNSKLTEKEVVEIRKLYKPFEITQKSLATKYNVSLPLINAILSKKLWKHLA